MYFCGRKNFQIKHQETIIHLTWTERKTVTHTKLHININHKTANDIVKVALEQVGNVGRQPFCLGMVLAHELNGVLVLSVGVLIKMWIYR